MLHFIRNVFIFSRLQEYPENGMEFLRRDALIFVCREPF
jgi:hypothetical protein